MTRKILTLFFGVLISLSHASDGLQRTDQDFYDDGVVLRKAKNYDDAKKCFSAALFTEDKMLAVKALYNLGHIAHAQGRIQDASLWFFQSNEAHKAFYGTVFPQAVRGSQILLQGGIASFFSPAKEIFSAPNRNIRDLFNKIEFSSPCEISLKQSFTVTDGDLEVHFRDADHLRAVVERTPLFSGENTYYVLDAEAEDGKEFKAIGGAALWEKFVHVEADEGLVVKGSIPYMPFAVSFPKQTNWQGLSMAVEGGLKRALPSLDNSLRLLSYLGDISDESIMDQKEIAIALLKERRADREAHPEKYPSLEEVSPERCLLSDAFAKGVQEDYIGSDKKPFYVASDKTSFQALIEEIPIFGGDLFFVDSHLPCSGIYTDHPLCVNRGFTIECAGNLVAFGKFLVEDYCLKLSSGKNMWLIGTKLKAKSILVSPALSAYMLILTLPIEEMPRPKNMSDGLWNAFYKYHSQ